MTKTLPIHATPLHARYHRNEFVVKARRGADTVLMDLSRGAYFSLDEVGSLVWELVESSATVDEIIERVAGEYSAPRAVIETDIHGLLISLLEARLISSDK